MNDAAVRYTAGTVLVGVAVAGAGVLLMGGDAVRELAWGSAVAVVMQVAIFWTLFVWALPEKRLLAYGVGVLVRFAAVAGMALIGVSAMGLRPAPTLLSMVVCLFGSTLLEAYIIQRPGPAAAGTGPSTMRT